MKVIKKGTRSRIWRRLGIKETQGFSLREELEYLADVLEHDEEPLRMQLNDAAYHLRRLAKNPKALKAIEAKEGRPRKTDRRADMALDYLVQRKLHGKGKFTEAKQEVAEEWHTSDKNVESTFAEFGHWAETRLAELLGRHVVAESDEPTILRMISADLRDIHHTRLTEV